MNYQLKGEQVENKRQVRTYINTQGTEVKTYHIYTDKNERKYWGFVDLYKMPIQREIMARHISGLYSVGLTLKDILGWCDYEKKLIRSTDPEKYEKLYAMILEKEKIAKTTADPIRQHLALCTVYILEDDERIDYFDEDTAEKKIKDWSVFPEMVAFFLSWHTEAIQRYMKTLEKVSRTVMILQQKQKKLFQQPK